MHQLKYVSMSMLLGFALTACTTMQPLSGDLTIESGNAIKPGDEITIVTKTGEHHAIKVSSLTEDRIIGEEVREAEPQYPGEEEQFRLEDIDRIDTRKLSAAAKVGGTVAAGGVIVVLVVVTYAVYTAVIFEIVKVLAF